MSDIAKRFEILILRPLHILFLVSAVFFLVKGMWWRLAGCAVGNIYLGIIGSKLHPFQSASNLTQGPIEGYAARIESELMPQAIKQMLVGHACTRVGILMGVTGGVISMAVLGWRWYFALLVGGIIMLIFGAFLKLAFKTIL